MRTTTLALACIAMLAACERDDGARRETGRSISIISLDTTRPSDSPTKQDGTAGGGAADEGDVLGAATSGATSPTTTAALRAALDRLASGAAREVDGDFSWFTGETAQVVRSATVDASGHAVVDFLDLRGVIPNASTSAGSQQLLDELNATVFSVDGVRSVEYRMNGDCALLGEWLQYGVCLRFDRPD